MGNWSVNYTGTDRICIIMDVAIQLELFQATNKTIKINVPINATSNGICGATNQIITLHWNDTISNKSLDFGFSKIVNVSEYEMMEVNYTVIAGEIFFN